MNQQELKKLGFVSEEQYNEALSALKANIECPYGLGFTDESLCQTPFKGADYSESFTSSQNVYPVRADLSVDMLPVFNQGERGTCVANAVVALVEYYFENKYRLSRQFFYWALKHEDGGEEKLQKWLKNIENNELEKDKDFMKFLQISAGKNADNKNVIPKAVSKYRKTFSGGMFDTALKVLDKYGICREELMSYVPTDEFNSEAQDFTQDHELQQKMMRERIMDAERLKIKDKLVMISGKSIDAYKKVLSGAGGKRPMPVVMGVSIFASLHSEYTSRTGWFSCPFENDRIIGGHAMLAVGYVDDNTGDVPGNGYLLVKNSWGNKWAYDNKGHQGYAKIPYSYIEKYGSNIAFTIEACDKGNDFEDDGWPPKKDQMEKYIKIASKMMKNRKGLFNIGKGESIIEDPESGKVDKDTPANRQIFIENGYSWEKKDL